MLLAGARLALLQGSLPAFSAQDNPPAFHPSFAIRYQLIFFYNIRWHSRTRSDKHRVESENH